MSDPQLDLLSEQQQRRRFDRTAPPPSQPPPTTADDDGDRLLFAAEVARILGVTLGWVYAKTRSMELPHVKVGRYYRYRKSSILKWIADQEQGA